jgi:disulfide bond formation protein DsbB
MSDRRLPLFPAPLILAAGAVAAGALALLLGALIFEHGLGLAPCPLCLDQRGPHAAAAILALTAALVAASARDAARIALGAAALVLLIGAGLALYHSGVELHWWPGPRGCSGRFVMPASAADFQAALSSARIIRCDSVPWSLFGLSLANYNALLSVTLALLGGIAVLRTKS